MDTLAILPVLVGILGSIAGAIILCVAIERRNRLESRRELLGLAPGKDCWP